MTHPEQEARYLSHIMQELIDKVYANMEERERRGVDQKETRYILDKVLGINRVDPRLLPENNQGDGGHVRNGGTLVGAGSAPEESMLEPREIKLVRELLVEANA